MITQPDDRVGVQVVGGLVEQQGLTVTEQDARQFHPAALPTGQRAQRLMQHPVGQAEAGGERGGLGFGGVPAEYGQPVAEVPVPAYSPVRDGWVGVGHPVLGLTELGSHLVEATRRQHPVKREDFQVTRARILRQVADGAAAPDGAGRGLRLTRQRLAQRGLARAVAPDQADAVALGDLKRGVGQQQPGPGAQFDISCDNHDSPLQIGI